MNPATLVVSHLSVGYGRRRVLDSLDLAPIGGGHVTALVGPNGAGKSTLLRALAGLIPSNGSAKLNDVELTGLSAADRSKQVGFMPQTLPAGVTLSVLEGVLSALRASSLGEPTTVAAEQQALDVLERVGIADLALHSLDQLSGGERQLAGLAQAIVRQPTLLLLDEPTSALDLGHQETVMTLVRALAAEGRVVIVVLHDLNLAARWAEHVVVMRGGVIAASGSPATAIVPDVLAGVYGVDARVERCSRGRPLVVVDGLAPARR